MTCAMFENGHILTKILCSLCIKIDMSTLKYLTRYTGLNSIFDWIRQPHFRYRLISLGLIGTCRPSCLHVSFQLSSKEVKVVKLPKLAIRAILFANYFKGAKYGGFLLSYTQIPLIVSFFVLTLDNSISEDGQSDYEEKIQNLFKTMRVWVIECEFP